MLPIVHRRHETTIRRLKPLERVLVAAEIAVTYVGVRILMLRDRDMRSVVARIRSRRRPASGDTAALALHLGAIVDGHLRRLPGDTRCLARSLVLLAMLARRGLGGSVVIGVRSAPTFGAHAWVELDGRSLLQPIEPTGSRLVEL